MDTSSNDDEIISSNISGYRRLTAQRLEDNQTKCFRDTITQSGVILSINERPHIITKEQSLIIRDISKCLSDNNDDDNTIQFLRGFKIYCKKPGFLRTSLIPTVLRKTMSNNDDDLNLIGMHQESLIRILFQVNSIQNEVMEFILEQAIELVGEDSDQIPEFKLILNALKYLPFINSADVVTQKLLDMIEIGTVGAQLEILYSIPDIIPDSQYETTAKKLIRILEDNDALTGGIIDCLNSLNLSSDTRIEIQQYIIERLLNRISIDTFPVLFEFLTSDCKPINLPAVLLKCRDALNQIMRNEAIDKERESKKVVLINKLEMLSASKIQYEGWMNLYININNFKTVYKPIDILILVVLHSNAPNRKRPIEALIKKHVKSIQLKRKELELAFEKYFVKQLLDDYFTSILEIASSLFRTPTDQLSIEFASNIFTLLFENENIISVQRQDILHRLIILTSGWETKNIGDILKILLELSKSKRLKSHIPLLMGLLEKVDTFELKDVKQVFELLSYLTCSNPDEMTSRLKDELHMLIRKQISCFKRPLKQRGIIAAVVMAKHIAITSEQPQSDDPEESLADISNLPSGAPQESASLLELAKNATSNIPELMGLYYDQLASMLVRAPNLDRKFMQWLQENVQEEFENTYTQHEVPKKINDIPVYTQFCLNEVTELNEDFHVNIAGLTPGASAITLLAPLFRMFRMLCSKYQGDLEAIDALLGCGVLLPELDDLSIYDRVQSKMVADSLFHCINWFREIASAFVRHPNKKLRVKLVKRIGHLVELEGLLVKCLKEQIPYHKLPASYFYDVLPIAIKGSPIKTKSDDKIKQPRKRLKKNTGEAIASILNDSTASTSTPFVATQKRKAPVIKRRTQVVAKPEFRELDTDLIILLKYPLNLNEEATSSPDIVINIPVFQYILNDVVEKLNSVVNNKNLGMSNLGDINAASLVTDCVKFAPKVFKNFVIIAEEIQTMLDKENALDDMNLYTTEAKILKNSFLLCLEYFKLLFNWKGFATNLGLLRDCLRNLVEEDTSSESIKYMCRSVATKFITRADQCLSLQAAISFVKIVEALYKINTENSEIKKKLTEVSGNFLNKKWYNDSGDIDAGKLQHLNLDYLIKSYLDGTSIKTISDITETLQTEIKTLETKDDYLEMMESINKTSFPVLYKNICNFTLNRVKIEIASLTNKEHLILWKTTANIMCSLMNISKIQDNKQNYISFLQKSNAILKVFLSHGIPILEIMLKSKPDEVVEILRTLQTTTRFLHNLCCTSKLTKDGSIMAHVPKFKETLETLVYRVKAALVANDCSGAFWMGNLKNKYLDGEEILSQPSTITTTTDDNDVEDEEELPPDDSDDDDDILGQHDETSIRNGDGRSASEVYD